MIQSSLKSELTLSDKEFLDIAALIKSKLGIVLGIHKKDMLYRRLSKRVAHLHLTSFAQYHDYLLNNVEEHKELANAVTTNLTSFFREEHHFEHLAEQLKIHFQNNKNLTIWSAGCSRGCEVYSIVMIIFDVLQDRLNGYKIKLLATDIDTDMLDVGVSGTYDIEYLEKIPPQFHKYLTVDGDQFQINSQLRSLVSFKRLNLLEKWPISKKFDMIFCRNTMIYFDKDTQKTIFSNFANALQPNKFLYIGHSENMSGLCDKFTPCGKTIYQRGDL